MKINLLDFETAGLTGIVRKETVAETVAAGLLSSAE